MQEKVARLRQLMSEAVSREYQPSKSEQDCVQLFRIHEFNTAPAVVVDTSPRAKAEREIERIATWYSWSAEIVRQLDAYSAASLSALPQPAVDELLQRMQRLEECVREGLDCPDAPPAR